MNRERLDVIDQALRLMNDEPSELRDAIVRNLLLILRGLEMVLTLEDMAPPPAKHPVLRLAPVGKTVADAPRLVCDITLCGPPTLFTCATHKRTFEAEDEIYPETCQAPNASIGEA